MCPAAYLPRVYIDGQSGTVGLRIRSMLAERRDLTIVEIDPARRRDPDARRQMLCESDVAILCLPDDAAKEAVSLAAGSSTRFIDGSTAHRVHEDWAYGLPELTASQRDAVRCAQFVSNPGCYPTGVSLLLRPLVDRGLVSSDTPVTVHALSGYSGGGKALVDKWQAEANGLQGLPFEAPYATDRQHKHIPEMKRFSGLKYEPLFVPAVGAFECGMRIQVPLHGSTLPAGVTPESFADVLEARYCDEPAVRIRSQAEVLQGAEVGLDPTRCNGHNRVELSALPHPDGHVVLVAVLDNLGKGASGAAVQNLNLMLGLPEWTGLTLG